MASPHSSVLNLSGSRGRPPSCESSSWPLMKHGRHSLSAGEKRTHAMHAYSLFTVPTKDNAANKQLQDELRQTSLYRSGAIQLPSRLERDHRKPHAGLDCDSPQLLLRLVFLRVTGAFSKTSPFQNFERHAGSHDR